MSTTESETYSVIHYAVQYKDGDLVLLGLNELDAKRTFAGIELRATEPYGRDCIGAELLQRTVQTTFEPWVPFGTEAPAPIQIPVAVGKATAPARKTVVGK